MIVKKTELPDKSILKESSKNYDYIDSYQTVFLNSKNNISSTEIGKCFFSSSPKWIDKLFDFRNKLVNIFNLNLFRINVYIKSSEFKH